MNAAVRAGAAALVLLFTAGCRPEGLRERGRTGTLTILYPGNERVLGPEWDMPAQFLVSEPLVSFDEHGDLVGALARSWQHSPDYRTWTVHLRTDVRWHDGLWPMFRNDVPITLLFPQVNMVVASRRVRGLASPFRSDPVEAAQYLWIER